MEKFWQIGKKIGDLYELDNSKKKIFFEKKISKLKRQISFFDRFLSKVKFFLSIAQIELGCRKLGH